MLPIPKATSAAIIQRLNAEVNRILRQAEMKARFDDLALELIPSTPEEVGNFTDREQAKWAKLVKDLNIKLDR